MEINYPIVIAVLVAVILLLVYLIWKDQKDRKKFEKQFTKSELDPDKHDQEHL
jgi:hypothetical protein